MWRDPFKSGGRPHAKALGVDQMGLGFSGENDSSREKASHQLQRQKALLRISLISRPFGGAATRVGVTAA